ncbi:GNAT family N-acetyltransferase [Nonomuraea sp. NPDC050663]|uniref:GNAT family N-acetyltransferase n=1 Tax=Nonomuraea sp. NPDC050663 TaxID=3364370 RepID=UPI00379082EB
MIRAALPGDVDDMAKLMARRREQYEHYQPLFWRRAEGAEEGHAAFLTKLVEQPSTISLVAASDGFAGFVIASLAPSPPVYDPGGPTCLIDDFSVTDDTCWRTVGVALLEAACDEARSRGAVQVVVVCGQADEAKRSALRLAGLTVASEWWTAALG